jgi:hypothetical protein
VLILQNMSLGAHDRGRPVEGEVVIEWLNFRGTCQDSWLEDKLCGVAAAVDRAAEIRLRVVRGCFGPAERTGSDSGSLTGIS